MPEFRHLAEAPGNPYRLGRHQVPAALVAELEAVIDLLEPIRSVAHEEYAPCFDQGRVGDCTMNAAYGCMVTAPYGHPGVTVTQDTILSGYSLETGLDDSQIPGHYPPDDTGSTGAWSMTVLQHLGLIKSWHHTRALHTALVLLNKGPISIGIPWLEVMFTPDATGTIHVDRTATPVGGHQITVVANDTTNRRIRIRNSWGTSWGEDGHAWLSWDDFGWLLKQGGDVVQPVL